MSVETTLKRVTVPAVKARKGGEPLVCLTAYTAAFARVLDPHTDILLVGDSVAMVHHGHATTHPITLDEMIVHARAVMRSTARSLVILDMPFGSFEESPEQAFRNAARVVKETGVAGVKLEGGAVMAETIAFLVARGIPVMAHIGLLPQAVHTKGGFKVTGRDAEEWPKLKADAVAIADAGAFSVVIEGMVEPLAAEITKLIAIPTIGIGASPACDGQILVTEDLLGLTPRQPRFVKPYAALAKVIDEAAAGYAADVKARRFPGPEQTYT